MCFLGLAVAVVAFAINAFSESSLWFFVLVFFALAAAIFVELRKEYRRGEEISKYNKQFPLLYEEWENSWLCHKCGHFGPLG